MGDFKDWEGGQKESKAKMGQTIIEAYPLDRSSGNGTEASKFPGRGRKLAGGVDDLSHSLSGAGAEQGPDKRGRETSKL
jgi:hypothetical protein